jgi:uncharacterized protein YbaP (TraB family)
MTKPRILLILALLFSTISLTAQTQKYQSRFWKISKEGRPDSYLYGTMHVSDKIAFNLSDSFYIAVQSVKTVGLESNPSEWLDSFNTFNNAFSFSGLPRFSTHASPGFYQNSIVFRKVENDDISSWLKTKSGILNAMLYRENSYNKEYQEDTWLEMHIYQTASKSGIPVVSLEGFTESRELVMQASFEEANNKIKKIIPKWLEDILEDKNRYTLIEDAYRNGDLDMIDTINRIFNSPGYYKYMLAERNIVQVDNFEKYEKEGSVFMAVGAAHLPGSEGVIEVLRQRGYTVSPIQDKRTDYAKGEKDRLDSIYTSVDYNKASAPNNTFTMAWPDKLYGSTSGYTNSTLGYDLSNGVYFINQQMNTYRAFYGLTQEQLLQKTDSLLFENIPGDIESKERIDAGGIPGIEIKNVTRSGDYEQYRIYATPFQMSMFKLSGRKNRIEAVGDSIFSTLKLQPLSKQWSTMEFVSGQFTVNTPVYRVMNIIDPIETMYSTPYLQAYDNSDNSYYLVKRVSVHDVDYIEEDDFEMKRFAEKLIEEMDYETISIESCDYHGMPCADFTAKTAFDTYVHGRFVMHRNNYYFMLCSNGKKKHGPAKFFNSLTFKDTKYSLPSEQFMDTVMKASVYASPLLNKRYLLEREYAYSSKKGEHKSIQKSKRYYSECDDLVKVRRKVFGKYDHYEKIDSLWKEVTEKFEEEKPFFITNQKASTHNGLQILDVELTDTGSIKAIRIRCVLSKNEDVLYTLSSLRDSLSTSNEFVTDFYDKFAPMDTVIRPSIFSNKARLVIEDYLNEDEEIHKDVLNYINGYGFYKRAKLLDTDLDIIKKAIYDNPYAQKETFMKTIFITMLGDLKSDSAAELLKTLYFDHEDDYPVQIATMESLANIEHERGTEILQDILENTLVFISPSDISLFYTILSDSNRIEKQMYTTLLEKMPDVYKDDIYGVLSWAAYDTTLTIKPVYGHLLPDIMKRYRFELKKSKVNEQVAKLEKSKSKSTGGNSYSNYDYGDYSLDMFSSSGGYYGGTGLLAYYKLLVPYDTVPEINELVKGADALTTYNNIKSLQEIRMTYNREINPDKVSELFEDEDKMLKAYDFIVKIERTDLLPDSLKDVTLFAKHCLNYKGSKYDLDKDTIQYLKKEEVIGKKGEMDLYYFQVNKYKDPIKTSQYRMNDPSYRIVCMGFPKSETSIYPTKYDFYDYTSVDSEEKIQDAYDELKESAEINGRKRAKPSKGRKGYYGY